jgi:hypothetical protein
MRTIIGIVLATIFISSCSDNRISPTNEQIDSTLKKLEEENEQVIQAIYNEGGVYNWVVAVNGASSPGSWKGYASAMCNTLYEANILSETNKNTTISHGVRVVDARKYMDTNGNFREASLGSADCKTFQMNDI